MSELNWIKGKKILCIYDYLVKEGKLEKEGKSFHNARYMVVAGENKKAYAVVSQPMSWINSPKIVDKTHFNSNAKVEAWKLWCSHKNYPFPSRIKREADAGRIKARLEGKPFAVVCKSDIKFQFVK